MSEEKRFTEERQCEHCRNRAPMEISYVHSQVSDFHDRYTGASYESGWIFDILICPACKQVILRRYFWHEDMFGPDDLQFETVYPAFDRKPLGLPQEIAQAYEAAQNIKRIDANSFAVLLGRVLEMICMDRGAKGKTLNEQLADLAQKDEIPKKLVGVANGLRNLRNVGAHATIGKLTSKEVPMLEDLARA